MAIPGNANTTAITAINSVEVAEESSTSRMREFFSSSTERITEMPYNSTAM